MGKTWVSSQVLSLLREAGVAVAARKPAQSFAPSDEPGGRDAAVLGTATGESAEVVCPPHRWYEVPMAPPMAADALGRQSFSISDLLAELSWGVAAPDLGLVETAGGVRSPLAWDGDCLAFCAAVAPDVVLLVADAGLGTISLVRLTMDALESSLRGVPVLVALNRYNEADPIHLGNRDWLRDCLDSPVVTTPGDEKVLADLLLG
jgi:dethiobiotin synthetase